MGFLQRLFVNLIGTNPYDMVNIADKDFPVTNLAGFGSFFDGVDCCVGKLLRTDVDLELDFWDEVYDVFCPAIELTVSLLATVTFDL